MGAELDTVFIPELWPSALVLDRKRLLRAAGDLLLNPLREAIHDYGMPFLTRPLTVARAALTADAGLLGAAAVGLMRG